MTTKYEQVIPIGITPPREFLGVVLRDDTADAVDVTTRPGEIGVRSSFAYHHEGTSGRRASRAYLTPSEARELAELLVEAANLVSDTTAEDG